MAALCGVNVETVRGWARAQRPGFPRPLRIKGRLRFLRSEILAWLEGLAKPVATEGSEDAA